MWFLRYLYYIFFSFVIITFHFFSFFSVSLSFLFSYSLFFFSFLFFSFPFVFLFFSDSFLLSAFLGFPPFLLVCFWFFDYKFIKDRNVHIQLNAFFFSQIKNIKESLKKIQKVTIIAIIIVYLEKGSKSWNFIKQFSFITKTLLKSAFNELKA